MKLVQIFLNVNGFPEDFLAVSAWLIQSWRVCVIGYGLYVIVVLRCMDLGLRGYMYVFPQSQGISYALLLFR